MADVSELIVVRSVSSSVTQPTQPSLVFIGDRGSRIVLPYAPLPTDLTDGAQWEQVKRDGRGRKPWLLPGQGTLPTLQFTLTLAREDHQEPVEDWITALRNAAKGVPYDDERWTMSYGPQEAGLWRFTALSIQITQRQYLTNLATRATAQVTLTDAGPIDPITPQPIPKPKPPATPAPKAPSTPAAKQSAQQAQFFAGLQKDPAAAAYFQSLATLQKQLPATSLPATYAIRSGDTLSALSVRWYGNVRFWPLIGGVNGIRDPTKLAVGQVIKIPHR